MSAIRGIGQDILQRAYQDAVGKTAAPAESGFAGRLNALLGEVDAAQDKALAVLPGLGARMDQLIAEGETDRDVGILARDTKQD